MCRLSLCGSDWGEDSDGSPVMSVALLVSRAKARDVLKVQS